MVLRIFCIRLARSWVCFFKEIVLLKKLSLMRKFVLGFTLILIDEKPAVTQSVNVMANLLMNAR